MFRQLRKNPDFLTILGGVLLASLLTQGAVLAETGATADTPSDIEQSTAAADGAGSSPAAEAPDATALVQRADAIRFPRESFETLITVTNYSGGEAGDVARVQGDVARQ